MKIQLESNILKYLLRNVYFITGTAYAGKSTMVHLLAEKHNAIECGENYHDALMEAIDREHQPNLSYFETMSGWQEFVTRTPEQYDAWMTGVAREAQDLELIMLLRLAETGKKIFVDTNILLETLHAIAEPDHVAVMLAPQEMSVSRFFDRPDIEKQFIYQELMKCPDPQAALANYRKVLEKVNSKEHYDEYANSGFFVTRRTEERTLEEALDALETHFGLKQGGNPHAGTHSDH